MSTPPESGKARGRVDLIALARRVDAYADEADSRRDFQRASELRKLASALRRKAESSGHRSRWPGGGRVGL